MSDFHFERLFQIPSHDDVQMRFVTKEHVEVVDLGGEEFLRVAPEALTTLAREAFRDVSHLLRPAHLEKLASILDDDEASPRRSGPPKPKRGRMTAAAPPPPPVVDPNDSETDTLPPPPGNP